MKKLVSAVVLLASGASFAAGYQVDTHAARATGMATAVTAAIDDPSAVLYNPAGISQGTGFSFYLGDTLIIPAFDATYQGTKYQANRTPIPPPHLYATFGITDDLSVGVGLFSLYGSALGWGADFPGRFVTASSSLSTYNINPEVAYRFGPLKIGAGLQIVRGTVELKQAIGFVDSDGSADIGGGGWGFGGNAGLQVEVVPKAFWAGLSYRSAVKLPLSGSAHFSNVPADFQSLVHDQNVKTRVALPDTVNLGIAYQPIHELRLGLDADYTAWQHFHDLTIRFDDPRLNATTVKRWHHTINVHLGGELTLAEHFDVRAGVIYDPTASPSDTIGPDLPDSNRVNLALGVGFHTGGFRADLGYQAVFLATVDSTYAAFPATYSGNAQVLGLSLGYTFK